MIFLLKDKLRLLARLAGGVWPMIFAKAPEGFGSAECKVSPPRDSGGMRSVNAERLSRGILGGRGAARFDHKPESRYRR